mmetsp:Transcript_113538/g.321244  ORF Transcript_113538/g.321244 Transcript_113538/m.321244 type:complete len:195 (+) Transcript_113538:90-674(+)|eukprot:CAMPEP_0117556936 /NCGR_PEP_ID=MMETSP0784-20121206/52066_1 /TAXON_ID=39447 /ORGANISM="" /LENGTH=194 /DNA_ID=CAMNT_0005354227 /DNA_START=15 /DNA_END=599 /DNA_ORIENTATION=-
MARPCEFASLSQDDDADLRNAQSLTVLRAAAEIVRRKRAEAIEKEQYEEAAKFHQKLQALEAKIAAADSHCGGASEEEASDDGGASAAPSGEGSSVRPCAPTASSLSAASSKGVEGLSNSGKMSRSLFAVPNPFQTVKLLRDSGYSAVQAYGLLGLLYIAVFALEVLLISVVWNFFSRDSLGGEDVGEEAFEEF